MKISRIQWKPNAFRDGKTWRLCLNRMYFRRKGPPDCNRALSAKISTSIVLEPRDLWIGAYWDRNRDDFKLFLCLIPCLPLRLHLRWAYGGYLD